MQPGKDEPLETSRFPVARRQIFSWCLFDWANSAYPTVVITFVFAAYFTERIALDKESGTGLWGLTLSISGLALALLAPVAGAIADRGGRRKRWIFGLSLLCVLAAVGLWWAVPDPGVAFFLLVLVGIGNLCFELAQVFYNAMLPDIAGQKYLGRISGWAWGVGYAGGLACLALCLVLFVQPDPALFGLDREAMEQIRVIGPFVGFWYFLFALPLFLVVRETYAKRPPVSLAVTEGLRRLWTTIKTLPSYGQVGRFLLARMLYIDGLNTLFAFGGIYAAGTFGMSFDEILVFAILLNVTAGLGAAVFGWIDDFLGSKRTIEIAVLALTLLGGAILLVESKFWFYVIGAAIGVFIGPAQAASRTFMARVAPAAQRTEFFGLYALTGKATAFLGPAMVGWVTVLFDSQRAGMATVLVFFLLGLIILRPVREDASQNAGSS